MRVFSKMPIMPVIGHMAELAVMAGVRVKDRDQGIGAFWEDWNGGVNLYSTRPAMRPIRLGFEVELLLGISDKIIYRVLPQM